MSDVSRSVRSPVECFTSAVIGQVLTDGGLEPPYLGELFDVVRTFMSDDGFIRFFLDESLFGMDVSATGVGHALLLDSGQVYPRLRYTIDRLVAHTRPDGVIEAYASAEDEHEGRTDECALASALYLLFLVGREGEAQPSFSLMTTTLVGGGFGSHPCPDALLYFVSRIVRDFPRTHPELLQPIRRRLIERFGSDASCLDRAIRVAAADNVGILDVPDLEVVSRAQRPDGTWPAEPLFGCDRTRRCFGSEALSTAFAVRALVAGGERGIGEVREALRREQVGWSPAPARCEARYLALFDDIWR